MAASPYFNDARSPRYAILFAAPLLIAYELAAAAMAHPGSANVRNGADVLLKSLFIGVGGRYGLVGFEVTLLGIGAWLVVRDWRRHPGPLRWRTFAQMLAESIMLALLLGVVLRYVTAALLHFFTLMRPAGVDMPTQLMVSLGAGIYEELLFRVILVTALTFIATRLFRWSSRGAGAFAVLTSALIFSAFHYVGAYGDAWQWSSFLFRFLAGLAFSSLYVLRGFGITAWSHALYDVMVTVA